MLPSIFNRKYYILTVIFGLIFIFSFTTPSSEAHVLIIADGGDENPEWVTEANNTARALENKGYEVKELYGDKATGKNIMKGMYNADAVIYIGHGGYQTGHYDMNGGEATPPFALVGSDEFVWGVGSKIREGWDGPVITAPFKTGIPVILSHSCFSTGYVGSQEVANPEETIYNFSRMFTGAGANYYASGYYGSYNGKTVVDLVDEFLEGATTFQAANNQNGIKLTSYTTYSDTKIWRYSQGYAAFVGDWNASFPLASQTTPYNDAAAEAWYQSIISGNTDLTSPIIKSIYPKSNATGVSPTSTVAITFNENIQAGDFFTGIYLKNMGTDLKVGIDCVINGAILTITPSLNLLNSTDYQLYLPTGAVKDIAGNPFMSIFTSKFQTAIPDTTPPQVSATNPVKNATGAGITSPITITFNENIQMGDNFQGIYVRKLSTGSKMTITSKEISGKTLTIYLKSIRSLNTTFLVYLPAGAVEDIEGNSLASSYTFSFKTKPEATPPKVSSTKPSNNSTGVSLTSSIVITFSENIKAGSNYAGIYIKNLTTGKLVSFTKTISGKTLTLKMTTNRLSNNLYQVFLPASAVKDFYSNSLQTSYTFQFRTVK
jgi:methionine-rich copper-binding protein CopC